MAHSAFWASSCCHIIFKKKKKKHPYPEGYKLSQLLTGECKSFESRAFLIGFICQVMVQVTSVIMISYNHSYNN